MSRYSFIFTYARRLIMILVLTGVCWNLFAYSIPLPQEQGYKINPQAVPTKGDTELAKADPADWQAFMNPYNFSAMVEDGDYLWFASPMGVLKHNRNTGQTKIITTANSGINANYVSDMFKHSSGDMWFAHTILAGDDENCGGISILHPDGSWTVLNYHNAPFHSNNIMCLAEDGEGRVWIGYGMNGYSEGGMSCYDPINNDWQYFHKGNSPMPSNTVMSFYLATDAKLWVCLSGDVDPDPYVGGGLLSIQGYDWQAYTTEIADDPTEPLKDWYVKNVVEDSQGNIWFALSGSVDTALYKYDGSVFTRYEAPFDAMYWDIAIDSDNSIYVNGIVSRVYKFDGQEWSVLTDMDEIVDGHYIQNIFMDSTDKLWVAKYDDYMAAYEDGAYYHPDLDANSPVKGLNSFWCMDSDGNGNTWFGTGWYVWGDIPAASSLLYWDESQWQSYNYQNYQNYVVNDVAWDMQGNLLLATGDANDNAAVIFDMFGSVIRKTDTGWIKYDYETTGYPFIYAKLAQEDYNGYIWAGTNTDGLAIYDGFDWSIYDSSVVPNLTSTILDILASHSEPVVWVACGTGLFKVDVSDPGNYVWQHYHPANSDLPSWFVNTLEWGADGSLWIGMDPGLARFSNGEITQISALDDIAVLDLSIDEHGGLWIGTLADGLLYYRDDTVVAYTRENSPLPTNVIHSVASDKRGKLWVHPHNGGLYNMNYNSTSASDPALPQPVTSLKNYPNPFNPETLISFDLPEAKEVNIGIYNLKGQLVKSYPKARYGSGINQIYWDGTSDDGLSCTSGIYFVRVKSDQFLLTHKMTLMK